MPWKQWHDYETLSRLSIRYFRSSKRSNIYEKTVFFVYILYIFHSEVATKVVLSRKVFLKVSQNWQENTCVGVSFWRDWRAKSIPNKPDQPRNIIFLLRSFGKQKRAFNPKWFDQFKFLHYREDSDSVICHTCAIAN